jgi:hypothetical protein
MKNTKVFLRFFKFRFFGVFFFSEILTRIFLGGELIFRKAREDAEVTAKFHPKKGSAIIFPADLFHEGI